MKKLLFFTSCLSTIFANDTLEYSALESLPKVHLDAPISSNKYSYFTVGSGLVLQQVGVGRRYRSFETLKGYDIGFNVNSSPFRFFEFGNSTYPVVPSIKYTYLKYKNNSRTSSYFGVGYEVGLIVEKNPYPFSRSLYPVPNIGLIWGKERESIRFSQLQLNAIPAVGLVVGTGFLLFGSDEGFYLTPRIAGGIVAVSSAATLFSYSAGF